MELIGDSYGIAESTKLDKVEMDSCCGPRSVGALEEENTHGDKTNTTPLEGLEGP